MAARVSAAERAGAVGTLDAGVVVDAGAAGAQAAVVA